MKPLNRFKTPSLRKKRPTWVWEDGTPVDPEVIDWEVSRGLDLDTGYYGFDKDYDYDADDQD